MFQEAMSWQHSVEYVCVAFQNRVAHKMDGTTLHQAGEVAVGANNNERKLQHNDVDILYTKNQNLRWILIDEIFMIPCNIIGTFAEHFAKFCKLWSRTDSIALIIYFP